MSTPIRVLVIGAGIGGLSATLALRRIGCEVLVYERNAEVREIGAGLSYWSNGLRAAREIGVEEEILRTGSPIEWLENADWTGRPLQRIHVGRLGRHVALGRTDLLEPLLSAVGAASVRVGHRLERVRQDSGGVTAAFENGAESRGDLLVGADGIFSDVRRELHPRVTPAYAGHVAWRGIASFEHARFPLGVALSLMGRGKHFAVEPMTAGRLFWYATKNRPESSEAPAHRGKKGEVRESFRDCADPVPALIEATPEEEIFRNRVYDLPRVRPWSRGRVTLLGDAAHAMRPNLGQGACQAVEDAVVLGACLARSRDGGEAALRRYEALRRRRTGWVVYWSRQLSLIEYLEGPLAAKLRDAWLRLVPGFLNLPWFATLVRFRPERV